MFKNITNPIYKELKKLKLIEDKNLIKISEKTRNKKIGVYKDSKKNIILLEKNLTGDNFYKSFKYKKNDKKILNKNLSSISQVSTSKGSVISEKIEDDSRRVEDFKKLTKNKDVLDFGCGWGIFLSKLKNIKSKSGLEIRSECVNYIKKTQKNTNIYSEINDLKKKFDIISLFHVLEHFSEQVKILKTLRSKLKKKGKIIIEVPSANDYLLSIDDFDSFKNFTLWEEHLILHTDNSLKKILKTAGFKKVKINFYQRYNYANHLGWFINKHPGSHNKYKKCYDNKFEKDYENFLKRNKMTDTLIAVAENI